MGHLSLSPSGPEKLRPLGLGVFRDSGPLLSSSFPRPPVVTDPFRRSTPPSFRSPRQWRLVQFPSCVPVLPLPCYRESGRNLDGPTWTLSETRSGVGRSRKRCVPSWLTRLTCDCNSSIFCYCVKEGLVIFDDRSKSCKRIYRFNLRRTFNVS